MALRSRNFGGIESEDIEGDNIEWEIAHPNTLYATYEIDPNNPAIVNTVRASDGAIIDSTRLAGGGEQGMGGFISSALNMVAMVYPPAAPFIYAFNAVKALDEGNIVGAVGSALGAGAAFTGISSLATAATVVRVADAIDKGNYAGALTAVMGDKNIAGALGDTMVTDTLSLKDVGNTLTVGMALESGNIGAALTAAGSLTGSTDLQTAGMAANTLKAIESGNIGGAVGALAGFTASNTKAMDENPNIGYSSSGDSTPAEDTGTDDAGTDVADDDGTTTGIDEIINPPTPADDDGTTTGIDEIINPPTPADTVITDDDGNTITLHSDGTVTVVGPDGEVKPIEDSPPVPADDDGTTPDILDVINPPVPADDDGTTPDILDVINPPVPPEEEIPEIVVTAPKEPDIADPFEDYEIVPPVDGLPEEEIPEIVVTAPKEPDIADPFEDYPAPVIDEPPEEEIPEIVVTGKKEPDIADPFEDYPAPVIDEPPGEEIPAPAPAPRATAPAPAPRATAPAPAPRATAPKTAVPAAVAAAAPGGVFFGDPGVVDIGEQFDLDAYGLNRQNPQDLLEYLHSIGLGYGENDPAERDSGRDVVEAYTGGSIDELLRYLRS